MSGILTITLNREFAFTVAEMIAQQIHAEQIHRHLKRAGHATPHWSFENRRIAEVRAMVLSIPLGERYACPRREFIGSIRYHLRAIMKERGDAPRWQTYVASVAEFNGVPQPGHPDAEGWSTFVIKERLAA